LLLLLLLLLLLFIVVVLLPPFEKQATKKIKIVKVFSKEKDKG